ncbi:hypothetical protein GW835_01790 [archaeon]|nr:hypothetical protein [archaeon]NCP79281.1 hypothetical protein [archaeon]NCP98260.1 hypothetical protein [archaeon]NCQ07048.1 hypothetical protein [archaeon]NCQ50844.1 hypothetical protein [archaeon]
MTRKIINLILNIKENINKKRRNVSNVLKILEKLGFKVYLTPERRYKLDKDYNYVIDGK